MIDPRFAAAGGIPFAPGYGAQQVPYQQQQQHHHHHHHHRRNKHNGAGDSPLSRDESIHRVDHGHHNTQQSKNRMLWKYSHKKFFNYLQTIAYRLRADTVCHIAQVVLEVQALQVVIIPNSSRHSLLAVITDLTINFKGMHMIKDSLPVVLPLLQYTIVDVIIDIIVIKPKKLSPVQALLIKHKVSLSKFDFNRHNNEHRLFSRQLIGQRSSSVLGNEPPQVSSPFPPTGEGEVDGGHPHSRRHRHRRHHHHQAQQQQQNSQQASFGQAQQGHTSTGADGYGHINDELIFIERGEHSPHRQEPPPGYEYKGKIEVQNVDKEHHSQSQVQSGILPTAQPSGPCPPGWQQMVVTAAPGGPCPPGATVYTGQLGVGAGVGVAPPGIGGVTSFGSAAGGLGFGGGECRWIFCAFLFIHLCSLAGPIGAAGSGAGLANLAASLPFPPQGQLIADYIVESNAGGVTSSGGSGFLTDYQQTAGGSFSNQA